MNFYAHGNPEPSAATAKGSIAPFEDHLFNRAIFQKRLARPGAETEGAIHHGLSTWFWHSGMGSIPAKAAFAPLGGETLVDASDEDRTALEILLRTPSIDAWALQLEFENAGRPLTIPDDWYDPVLFADDAGPLRAEFEGLVSRAMGQPASAEELRRFIERVFIHRDAGSLRLFSAALRLETALSAHLLLGWKAAIAQEPALREGLKRAVNVHRAMKKARVMTSAEWLPPNQANYMQERLCDHLTACGRSVRQFIETFGAEPRRAQAIAGDGEALRAYLLQLAAALPKLGHDFAELERVVGLWAMAANRRSSELFPPDLFIACHASILGEDQTGERAVASKRS